MISRRTILLFLFAITCFGILAVQAWNEERPCREWKSLHPESKVNAAPVQKADGTYTVEFNPCNMWHELPWLDKSLAFGGFIASIAFGISLIQDLVRWVSKRKKRRKR